MTERADRARSRPDDRSYEPPRIDTLGKVEDLTRTIGPSPTDATDG